MVLMATIATYQLPLHQLRLDQQRMQIFQHLLITLQNLCRRCFCGEFWEAQLIFTQRNTDRSASRLFSCLDVGHTSVDVVFNAAQSSRGSTLMMNCGLTSISSCANSASLGCKGKEADVDLHALTAQVRKFMLSTFIFSSFRFPSLNFIDLRVNLCKRLYNSGSGNERLSTRNFAWLEKGTLILYPNPKLDSLRKLLLGHVGREVGIHISRRIALVMCSITALYCGIVAISAALL